MQKKVNRVQTGVRIEPSLLKVLKAVAADKEMKMGDLLEGILLHAFEGKQAFSDESLERISMMKQLYKCDLTAEDSHKLIEE